MVPRQSYKYTNLHRIEIAWVPLGSTLGDNDPFCHTMVPRQSYKYTNLHRIEIAWVPLGSTLGDNDPFCITNVHIGLRLPGYHWGVGTPFCSDNANFQNITPSIALILKVSRRRIHSTNACDVFFFPQLRFKLVEKLTEINVLNLDVTKQTSAAITQAIRNPEEVSLDTQVWPDHQLTHRLFTDK